MKLQIIYLIRNESIIILRVFDTKQNPKNLTIDLSY